MREPATAVTASNSSAEEYGVRPKRANTTTNTAKAVNGAIIHGEAWRCSYIGMNHSTGETCAGYSALPVFWSAAARSASVLLSG
jgi:hypothetical protein